MKIDFHDPNHRYSYTGREADESWLELVADKVRLEGVRAADIACGGGIYSKALATLGAVEVTGVDFSLAMLDGASQHCSDYPNVRFQLGDALQTGLSDGAYGVVLMRALIHHLKADQLADCFREAYRISQPVGTLLVQDRTPEDCLLPGGREHLRGYFFEKYPKLAGSETARRHSSAVVGQALAYAGFGQVEPLLLWEKRRGYPSFSQFRGDLLQRTGRTILHELNDSELVELADYIQQRTGYSDDEPLEEKDRWTVWAARKH